MSRWKHVTFHQLWMLWILKFVVCVVELSWMFCRCVPVAVVYFVLLEAVGCEGFRVNVRLFGRGFWILVVVVSKMTVVMIE